MTTTLNSELTATHGPLHLTNMKTKDIAGRGYNIVGYVLRREDGEEVCISAESAVRWLPQAHYWRLMHEQDESLFAQSPAAPNEPAQALPAEPNQLYHWNGLTLVTIEAMREYGEARARAAIASLAQKVEAPLIDVRYEFEKWMSDRGEAADYIGDGLYSSGAVCDQAEAFAAGIELASRCRVQGGITNTGSNESCRAALAASNKGEGK